MQIASDRRSVLKGICGGFLAASWTGAPARAAWRAFVPDETLDFGALEPLVERMQTLAPDALMAASAEALRAGTPLEHLVAAGALANARTFGGHDYVGFHCAMALMPAFGMSTRLSGPARALPVLKVLHRNARRIQEFGGRPAEVLHAPPAAPATSRAAGLAALREAYEAGDLEAAELAFAGLAAGTPEDALEALQSILRENVDVHRIVLAWRAFETARFAAPAAGPAVVHALLRQSLHFCVRAEIQRREQGGAEPSLRALLPSLVLRHGLARSRTAPRRASERERTALCDVVFAGAPEEAAEAMAAALAGGLSDDDAGAAIVLAANRLLRHDPGRRNDESADKPAGSVHGASVGVHAADAARAWLHLASAASPASAAQDLVAAAFHTAGQKRRVADAPFATAELADDVPRGEPAALLARLREAIESKEQARAMALAERHAAEGLPEAPLLALLLEFAISQDGALHAEKYFHTSVEELAAARPEDRGLFLGALARVSASEFGWPAPGLDAARAALGA